MQPIRTRWHKLLPLIEADEVYVTAPQDGKAAHWTEFGGQPDNLKSLLRQFRDVPRFVVDPELIELIKDEGFQKSLLDMKRAGVLRLPYPAMMVEYRLMDNNYQNITLLRDMQAGGRMEWEAPDFTLGNPKPFYGYLMHTYKDNDGEYLVVSPSLTSIDLSNKDGTVWLHLSGHSIEVFPDSPALNRLVEQTYTKDAGSVWYALAAAMLLMSTAGVKREVIEVERLNRKRVANGKEPIPGHTYITIGHVYKSEGSNISEEYMPRRSPRPHWRRGHCKMVHYGVGRASVKEVYINPKLVAYRGPEQPVPQVQEYHISK